MANYNGRRKIYTAIEDITAENVIGELNKALSIHFINMQEEEYLYWYRRGVQPILERSKEIRPEICNRIVVNNADMVVSFKNGYFMTKPAFYSSRKDDESTTKAVKEMNEYLYSAQKGVVDNTVIDWFHTVGVGAMLVEPNKDITSDCPISVYALDPRSAFVVYSLRPGNKPVMGVNLVVDGTNTYYDVFTETKLFRLSGNSLPSTPKTEANKGVQTTAITLNAVENNVLGEIPIIEYVYNDNRMSAFENALDIMDAINNAESNRLDGIEQEIQQLCVAYNCNFEEDVTANEIRKAGMICLKSVGENKADFKILTESLNQSETQTTISNLYEQMLEKCGVPSSVRDAGSTSDNVGAVYLRSGWAMADTHARNTEDNFVKSNKLFDKIFLKILQMKKKSKIKIDDFELKITRNDMSNLLIKTQAAMNMKELGFAPELAFERSGLSNDPLSDIAISQEYIDSKWQTQQDVFGGSPEEITDEDGKTQNNYQGNYISGYWRSKNGEKITDNRSPEEQEKAKQEEKK